MSAAQEGRPRPNWRVWGQLESVRAWEAVALSLTIEPTAVKQVNVRGQLEAKALLNNRIGQMAKAELLQRSPDHRPTRFDESPEFMDRLEVTICSEERLPTVGTAPDDPAYRKVRLEDFVAFALALSWQVPVELRNLAAPADPKLAAMWKAYKRIQSSGKAPTKSAVAGASGCDRGTVSKRWAELTARASRNQQ